MAEVRLSVDDRGRLVRVHAGDELAVTLQGLAGAGYEWQLVGEHPELAVTSAGSPAAAVGAGMETVRIGVHAPVRRALALSLFRRWEGPTSSIDTFEFTLDAS